MIARAQESLARQPSANFRVTPHAKYQLERQFSVIGGTGGHDAGSTADLLGIPHARIGFDVAEVAAQQP